MAALLAFGCNGQTSPAGLPTNASPAEQAEPLAPAPPTPVAWQPAEGEPLRVRITGDDLEWVVRYPGTDGELDTEDDILDHQHLHIPSGWPVEVQVASRDYLYTLRFPAWDLKTLALPDRVRQLELEAAEPGEFELRGDQFCGDAHSDLWGKVIVQSPDDFSRWLGEQQSNSADRD